jgi:hypothetical protein
MHRADVQGMVRGVALSSDDAEISMARAGATWRPLWWSSGRLRDTRLKAPSTAARGSRLVQIAPGQLSFLIGSESRQQKTEMFTGCFTAAFESTLVPFESNRRFSWLHRSPPKSAKARRSDWKFGCDMIFELTIKNRTRLITVISDGRGN